VYFLNKKGVKPVVKEKKKLSFFVLLQDNKARFYQAPGDSLVL